MNKNPDALDDILAEEVSEKWNRRVKFAGIIISLGFICTAVFIGVKQFYDYKRVKDTKDDAALFTRILYENPSTGNLEQEDMQYKTNAYIGLYENYKLGLILRNYEPAKAIVKCQKIADLGIDDGITEYNKFLGYSLRLRSGIAKDNDPLIMNDVSVYHILQNVIKMSLYTSHNEGKKALAISSELTNSFHLNEELHAIINEVVNYIIIENRTDKE
ncbi:hypothetical protein [Candidatus Fokinia crypta]|uniref:Tetratricopeptide repeat-like domain-containing protein n=1 Tax=Candidatus Fokinia crypta TaxID=1920990 RepID=A0ABZ0USY1_9RICK|nr:hypothetical protein [Candidatus Fokinia cryptica]WPX97798.1 hypothetical protein Fokcrypt_00316 [Candidatus Fokinia cryptica]